MLGELKRYFRDNGWAVHVPRGMQERVMQVDGTVKQLSRELGRSPSVAEIAESIGSTAELVLEAMEASSAYDAVSLDSHRFGDDGDGETYAESIGAEDERFELVEYGATIAPAAGAARPRPHRAAPALRRGPHPGRDRRARGRLPDARVPAHPPGARPPARGGRERVAAAPPAPPPGGSLPRRGFEKRFWERGRLHVESRFCVRPRTGWGPCVKVLGVNAVFHDPAAALVVDGEIVAATEEERFSRRKHGKEPVPFSTWELPEQAMRWCLQAGGLEPGDLDAVAYSYDPDLAPADGTGDLTADAWEGLRTLFVRRAPLFLQTALAGLDPAKVRHVGHHLSHAASAYAAYGRDCSVLVLDGRGERSAHLAGRAVGGRFEPLSSQPLPDSLGLLYEELTAHLGFRRSSDEYKVMAMASYGKPAFLGELRELVRADGMGGYRTDPVRFGRFAPALAPGEEWTPAHADLASSVQKRVEELMVELATWLHSQTGDTDLVLAGGVALNCVANSVLWRRAPFERIWVQPAAGDSGTALGAALYVARELGDAIRPMATAALGRGFSDEELEGVAPDRRALLRAPRRHRRGGRRDPRRRRRGGLVPRALGVRAARARAPLAARRPALAGQHGEAQRHQGARAVPARGAHGAGRAGGRALRGRCRPPTCSSRTACARAGRSGSPPSCTSTARPGSRRCTPTQSRSSRACSRPSRR